MLVEQIEISDCNELIELYHQLIPYQKIKNAYDFSNSLKKLTKLNLDENLIEDVEPLADLTDLKELYLQDNPIKNMDSLKILQEQK